MRSHYEPEKRLTIKFQTLRYLECWKTKAALAIDAFLQGVNPELALPDTGMAKENFREQMSHGVATH